MKESVTIQFIGESITVAKIVDSLKKDYSTENVTNWQNVPIIILKKNANNQAEKSL